MHASDQRCGIDPERSDHSRMAGLFFDGSIRDGKGIFTYGNYRDKNKIWTGSWCAKRDELQQQVGSDKELDIIEDASLVHNQCIIDLDSKIIDCSLDAQLDNLKEQLRMLAM